MPAMKGVRQIALKDMQSAILALPSPDSNVNSLVVVFIVNPLTLILSPYSSLKLRILIKKRKDILHIS